MLRNAVYFMLVGTLIIVVGFGVYIVNEYFNRLVVPEQPVLVYAFSKEGSGKYEIDFLGETLEVNTEVILKYANNILETGENKLLSLKNNPLMKEKALWLKEAVQEQYQNIKAHPQITTRTILIKEAVSQYWQEFSTSEKVRAVNQWIRDKSSDS